MTAESHGDSRIYACSGRRRTFLLVTGLGFAVAGVWGLGYFLTQGAHAPAGMLAVLACVFAPLGLYFLAYVLRYRIVLRPDAIDVRGILVERTLRRDEIAGRRDIKTRNARTTVLVAKALGARDLKLSSFILHGQGDPALKHWIEALPDLDAADLRRSEAEVLKNSALGQTPEERQAGLSRARRIGRIANGAAVAVGVWGLLYPHPYELAMLLLAAGPWFAFALAARSPGTYQLDQRRNEARPTLAILMYLPALALAMRALSDIHILEWQQGAVLALAGAVVLSFVATKLDRGLLAPKPGRSGARWASVLGMTLIGAAYGYGLGMQSDRLLDSSPPRAFTAAVVGKHISSGKSRSFNLHLAPWGPRSYPDNVQVRADFYETVQVGEVLCVDLYPGAIQVPWFVLRHCRS